MTTDNSSFLALDYGQARVGIARASRLARLAEPLATLPNDDKFFDVLKDLVAQENAIQIVIGLPRNLSGQDTGQTKEVREFAEQVKTSLGLPVVLQDEALTSKRAEKEMTQAKRIRPAQTVDSLAAVYILEDYLNAAASIGA